MTLGRLIELGFDTSRESDEHSGFQVRCSQCQALVINGVPTHEHGCPNAVHECAGCNELIPMKQKYCQSC